MGGGFFTAERFASDADEPVVLAEPVELVLPLEFANSEELADCIMPVEFVVPAKLAELSLSLWNWWCLGSLRGLWSGS